MARHDAADDDLPQVEIRGLRKTYGPVVALESADLSVRKGEFFTLLGPSGSGKTTLLSLIAGLQLADQGRIKIGGVDVTNTRAEKRDIGVVFQNYALFPHLTVAQNIAFPLEMRKVPAAQIASRVARAIDMVKLPQLAQRLPSELSGGQQQRVALARCLVYEPKIILMDEPLGALDKKLRLYMQSEIKRIHTDFGVTIIYVTHDQEEALTMSDRICLMRNAQVEQIGTPEELYFRPKSLFSADFLGESNFIAAEVLRIENGFVVAKTPAGETLSALSVEGSDIQPGQSIRIMVRPECVRVMAPDENADNEQTVTLGRSVLTGATSRLLGTRTDGTTMSAAMLTASRVVPYASGTALRLGWAKDACLALAEDATVV